MFHDECVALLDYNLCTHEGFTELPLRSSLPESAVGFFSHTSVTQLKKVKAFKIVP